MFPLFSTKNSSNLDKADDGLALLLLLCSGLCKWKNMRKG